VDVSSGVIAIVGHYTRKDNAAGKKPFPVKSIFLKLWKIMYMLPLLGGPNSYTVAENGHIWFKKAISGRAFEVM
jgi:hypothetical protein